MLGAQNDTRYWLSRVAVGDDTAITVRLRHNCAAALAETQCLTIRATGVADRVADRVANRVLRRSSSLRTQCFSNCTLATARLISQETSHVTRFPRDHVGEAVGETPCSPWAYTLTSSQLPALVLARGIRLSASGKLALATPAACKRLRVHVQPSLVILNNIASPYVHHSVTKEKTL